MKTLFYVEPLCRFLGMSFAQCPARSRYSKDKFLSLLLLLIIFIILLLYMCVFPFIFTKTLSEVHATEIPI